MYDEQAKLSWGTEVRTERIGGHDGRTWYPRPHSVSDLVEASVRWDDREFMIHGDRRVTFSEALGLARLACGRLAEAGVRRGDHVLVLGFNSPNWAISVMGVWLMGAVPVLGNRWWGDEERASATKLVGATAVLTDLGPDGHEAFRGQIILSVDELTAPGDAPEWTDAAGARNEDEVALVIFTSGSSGSPKGVALAHRSLIANQHNLLFRSGRLRATEHGTEPRQTVVLVALPMFHVGGVTNLLSALVMGSRLVLLEGRFDPAQVLDLIETERVTTWGGVPTMARRVLDHPDFNRRDLSSLRGFPLGGAPVTASTLDLISRKLPSVKRGLGNTWGMTESGGFLTLATGVDLVNRPGTVGMPYPVVEVRVLNPDRDGQGELLVRTPTNMLGYLGEKQPGTVDLDGWLHTGDVGTVDADGFVYITGRAKDIVIRGGENIACAHVEEVMLRHPSVTDAIAFGLPNEDLGEELAAVVVVPKHDLTSQALATWMKERIAYFEVPTTIRVVDQNLPVLETGKVDKQALKMEHMQWLAEIEGA